MGGTWLISSQSNPHAPESLLERYSAAVERFNALTTTDRFSTQTPSCSTSDGPGGNVSSLFDAIEKAIGYGIEPPQAEEGGLRPPLDTYETTPGPYGDVVRATDAYVDWFRRSYCLEGGEDRVSRARTDPPSEAMGGGDTGTLVGGRRFKQHDLMG